LKLGLDRPLRKTSIRYLPRLSERPVRSWRRPMHPPPAAAFDRTPPLAARPSGASRPPRSLEPTHRLGDLRGDVPPAPSRRWPLPRVRRNPQCRPIRRTRRPRLASAIAHFPCRYARAPRRFAVAAPVPGDIETTMDSRRCLGPDHGLDDDGGTIRLSIPPAPSCSRPATPPRRVRLLGRPARRSSSTAPRTASVTRAPGAEFARRRIAGGQPTAPEPRPDWSSTLQAGDDLPGVVFVGPLRPDRMPIVSQPRW
jgi:hypothetical protein